MAMATGLPGLLARQFLAARRVAIVPAAPLRADSTLHPSRFPPAVYDAIFAGSLSGARVCWS